MAIAVKNRIMQLQVSVNTGTNVNPKYKKLAMGGWIMDPNMEYDTALTAGQKLAACQTHTFNNVILTQRYDIVDE